MRILHFTVHEHDQTNLEQEVLCLELEPESRVDYVDEVVDDVAEAAGYDERLPPENIGP